MRLIHSLLFRFSHVCQTGQQAWNLPFFPPNLGQIYLKYLKYISRGGNGELASYGPQLQSAFGLAGFTTQPLQCWVHPIKLQQTLLQEEYSDNFPIPTLKQLVCWFVPLSQKSKIKNVIIFNLAFTNFYNGNNGNFMQEVQKKFNFTENWRKQPRNKFGNMQCFHIKIGTTLTNRSQI